MADELARLDLAARAPRAPVRPVVLTILLVLTAWLLVGSWILEYPVTAAAKDASLRETGAAVVVGLLTLRQRQLGMGRFSAVLVGVTGLLLAVSGLDELMFRVRLNELVTGVTVSLGGASLVVLPTARARRWATNEEES